MLASAADFVEAIRRRGLLEGSRLEELLRLPPAQRTDLRALARDLVRRDWLTAYQVNQLMLGRESDLLLGSYLLLERLGEGGMGQVFKARHQKLGRVVALKLIRPDRLGNAQAVKRFRREIQAAATLTHPNIVLAFDADQVGETHFFVMEYVEGVDLSCLVKDEGKLSAARASDYIRQAALGLQHAHERGLVHRDIKPQNLLLALKTGQIKLLDLGLALLQGDPAKGSASHLTQEGKVVGTVDFLAPEQAVNARKVDVRADLYSLGCTFYYLLSGQVPFPEGSALEKLANHRWEQPAPLPKEVPAEVAAVVRKLMQKKPEDRYQTPADLANALLPIAKKEPSAAALSRAIPLAQPAAESSTSETALSIQRARRNRRRAEDRHWVAWTGAGAAVLLLGLVGLGWLLVRSMEPPADTAKAGPLPLVQRFTNSANMTLVLISSGTFRRGSPETEDGHKPDEGPATEVTIERPFYIGIYPVTQGQYLEVMGTNPAKYNAAAGGGASCPVEMVSWNDAVAFCKKLSKRPEEKKQGRGYWLPTEAEWEYACRAGSKKAYCFGEDVALLDHYACYGRLEEGHPQPVGQLKPNAWGLYDVHGNVWQWCLDVYQPNYYAVAPKRDPQGPKTGPQRSCRGGGFNSENAVDLRAARRSPGDPATRYPNTGFRVVCIPEHK